MEPFNLKLAKQGHPVCTRSGKPARIICFDANHVKFPIIALIEDKGEEYPCTFSVNGRFYAEGTENDTDLMMASIKHEGWINIYRNKAGKHTSGIIFKSKEEAINFKLDHVINTVKIEWEE